MKNMLRFAERIQAPPAKVWEIMLADATYRDWTTPFAEGSYFEGSWEQGQQICFRSPGHDGGMVAVIEESRPHSFVSIKHIGQLKEGGVVDTTSEEVKKWAPAFENYHFTPIDGGTEVRVEMDVTAEWEAYMQQTWPKALARLKQICE
ncbi:MAG: SRPBCC domain-containing protein [Bryobacterales bacterium]|nr:SRPBCC domain-containing protein [Bryobacterales bacterium]